MQVVYAQELAPEKFTKSIFLAGPTPRSPEVSSWRKEALRILEENEYDGVVFVPEDQTDKWAHSYIDQVEWEKECLNMSDVILFWIPRELSTLPGFTTNVEFGLYVKSGRVVLGHPIAAPKTQYLDKVFEDNGGKEVYFTLEETVRYAMHRCGDRGHTRRGGERYIPMHIWKHRHFRDWYAQMKRNGNRLDWAEVQWVFYVNNGAFPFAWAIHVDIWVEAENRRKSNEFILSRPDITSIVLYQKPQGAWDDFKIVCIKEFRSTVRNPDGMVIEVAGGSSFKEGMQNVAIAEIKEETGLDIHPDRLQKVESRQPLATFSTHHSHLYRVELQPDEMAWVEKQAKNGTSFGNTHESEQTYLAVYSLHNLLSDPVSVDYATLGMIFAAITIP